MEKKRFSIYAYVRGEHIGVKEKDNPHEFPIL